MRIERFTPETIAFAIEGRGHHVYEEWVRGTRCLIALTIVSDHITVQFYLSGKLQADHTAWAEPGDVLAVHCLIEELRELAQRHPLRSEVAHIIDLWGLPSEVRE